MDVLVIRALLFGVCSRATDFWKLPCSFTVDTGPLKGSASCHDLGVCVHVVHVHKLRSILLVGQNDMDLM